jgi:hypothetical protein
MTTDIANIIRVAANAANTIAVVAVDLIVIVINTRVIYRKIRT